MSKLDVFSFYSGLVITIFSKCLNQSSKTPNYTVICIILRFTIDKRMFFCLKTNSFYLIKVSFCIKNYFYDIDFLKH